MAPPISIDQWMSVKDCFRKLLCAQLESNLAYE